MKTGELHSTKYLKQEDFPEPVLATVRTVTKENVSLPTQPKKERGVMYFEEYEKGMVLNATNLKRAEKFLGSDETDDWVGKKIVIYVDEDVEFGGEIVGGLRLKAYRQAAKVPIKQVEGEKTGGKFDELMDDVPF